MSAGNSPAIRVTLDDTNGPGRAAQIVIDNEPKLNSLTSDMLIRLADAARSLAGDSDLRVVILTGAGNRAFSGGADLSELMGFTADTSVAYATKVHEACAALRDLPVPVIARIRGACYGAALSLALACDLRMASTEARFAMPGGKLGMPAVSEAALLPRLIGWGRTADILLAGDVIDATTAHAWGLVRCAVSPDGLDAEVARLALLIRGYGPNAIRAQKSMMRQWESRLLDDAIAAGNPILRDAAMTGEAERMLAPLLAASRGRDR
ncbi:MAG: enoyl-CoA hydratase-related protein [Alphaproteobacteria bacterium]